MKQKILFLFALINISYGSAVPTPIENAATTATVEFIDNMHDNAQLITLMKDRFYSLANQPQMAYGRGEFSTIVQTPYLVAALQNLCKEPKFSFDESRLALNLIYLTSLDAYRHLEDDSLSVTIVRALRKIKQGDSDEIVLKKFYEQIESMQLRKIDVSNFKQEIEAYSDVHEQDLCLFKPCNLKPY